MVPHNFADSSRVLIAGDAILASDVPSINPLLDGTEALETAIATVERIGLLDAILAVAGHGEVIADVGSCVKRSLERLRLWRPDPARMAFHGCRRIFGFALMIHGGFARSELLPYQLARRWVHDFAPGAGLTPRNLRSGWSRTSPVLARPGGSATASSRRSPIARFSSDAAPQLRPADDSGLVETRPSRSSVGRGRRSAAGPRLGTLAGRRSCLSKRASVVPRFPIGSGRPTMRLVPEAIFERQGDLFLPTEATIGPWSREAQHGAPPTMLMARAVERVEAAQPVRVVRLTVELLRPVPVKPLRVSARLARLGRRADRVEATLHADEVEVARALALRIRRQAFEAPMSEAEAPPSLPEKQIEWGPKAWGASSWAKHASKENYGSLGVELRLAGGTVTEPGPASVWVRLKLPVVTGEEPSPLMRAAAAADFANGVSWVLDPTRFLFVNPDLSLHLHRQPVGEWICLAAHTRLDSDGSGVAEGVLYDLQGRIGAALQSLVVEPHG